MARLFPRRWVKVETMQLLEYPMLLEQEKIVVEELTPIQVPPLDVLLLEGSLEALYVTRAHLSQGKSPFNCLVNWF